MEFNSENAELGRYTELVGVYHADGSLVGELRYVWGKIRGTAHCALCDITHGAIREKASFRACREALPIPLRNVHLDERDPDVQAATEGHTPCVVGRTVDGEWEMVLDREALEQCGASVAAFEQQLTQRLQG